MTLPTVTEFFAAYQSDHPVADEQIRLTVIGLPEGAMRRSMQRMIGLVGLLTLTGAVVGASADEFVVGAVGGAMAGVVLSLALSQTRDLPLGVVASNKRVLLIQQRRGKAPQVVAERPPEALTRVAIDGNAEGFWYAGSLSRLTLSGHEGVIATLDLANVAPDAIRSLCREGGIELDESIAADRSSSSGPDGTIRFWFPKAFTVGLLYFIGGSFVVLAVAEGLDNGIGSGLVGLAMALALLGAGEGLRRVLLRPS
jgi:hypothetical protein